MKKIGLFVICTLVNLTIVAQRENAISGYIENCSTGERLIFAHVYSNDQKKTTTNEYGYFVLNNLKENDTIFFSYVGFETIAFPVSSFTSKGQTICLHENTKLESVTVLGRKQSRITNSIESIDIKTIKLLPSIDGESDILKAYQLLPGIASGIEGTNGIFVRGGSPDQNLILLDDVPLYYVNHIGGFVSVFNNSALSASNLQKGGFDARYGGRLSSVLDIRTKNGNMLEHKQNIHVGTISSGFALEGPLKKNHTSYLLTGRFSNIGTLMKAAGLFIDGAKGSIGFYDFNFKLNTKINTSDRLYFSIYSGQDNISLLENQKGITLHETNPISYNISAKTKSGNGINAGSLRWNHLFSSNVFSNLIFYYTNFGYNYKLKAAIEKGKNEAFRFENLLLSNVQEIATQYNVSWNTNHGLEFSSGIHAQKYFSKPKSRRTELTINNSEIDLLTYLFPELPVPYVQKKEENQSNIGSVSGYFDTQFKPNSLLEFYAGLRYNHIFYNQENKFYLEPRARITFKPGFKTQFSVDYAKMHQPIHFLISKAAGIPSDVWLTANRNFVPETSEQVSVQLNFSELNKFDISISAFAKKMQHLVTYKRGEDLFTERNVNDKLYSNGLGKTSGFEFFAKLGNEKINTLISYTYSNNTRQFAELNNGKPFPYKYTKEHDLNVGVMYKINEKLNLSLVWYYTSGTYMSIANEIYPVLVHSGGNLLNPILEQYNEPYLESAYYSVDIDDFRMPAYHRLDLNLNIKRKKSEWNFGLYNAYNKLNPITITWSNHNGLKLKGFTLFPLLPNFSYTYNF